MTTNEDEGYEIVSPSAYPIEPRPMTIDELRHAAEFIDTAARIDQSGICFQYLCRLLGEVRYRRSAAQ